MKTIVKTLAISGLAIGMHSCIISPVSANYETAKTLGKGNVEVMGNYTRYHSTWNQGLTNQNIGVRVGVGLSENFDLKLRYERLIEPKYDYQFLGTTTEVYQNNWNFLRITPKWSFANNKWAITTPISAYFLEGESSLFDIGVNFYRTFVIERNASFTLGLQNINYVGEGIYPFIGPSFGFSFGPSDAFQIRPELGALTDFGSLYFNYGIALVAFF